ncbi:conserved hypothetical protein [Anaeromyxobacter sp. K]|uniref:carboxypeptidase regulatory-like domain-containing protein n=1 Tax=Anaeromyxobacter sp. (strain K) TaxID=447217 RepID=UPI00017BE432|nr:carboxypeptidase regulatory-like domain-containing protein [Anaeromyxobacter sp. K]ACG75346.1 conserved hypothetical protein [Anaeromyxobacter sp. K]
MRARSIAIVVAVFAAAALTAVFVVSQLPHAGRTSPLPGTPGAAVATSSPPAPAASASDGFLDVRVTAGGAPQAGAEVRAYLRARGANGAPAWLAAGTVVAGKDGVARLAARPGAYLVAARAVGLAPGRAEVIRPGGEEVTHAEVALAPPVALSGRVTGPDGRPAPARLELVPLASALGDAAPDAPPEELARVETGRRGAFEVPGLAPGLYAVRADGAGFHALLVPRVAVPRAAPLELRLDALALLDGVVTGADGRPAAGAVVRAASADHWAEMTVGEDGRFQLPVPAGEYRLLAGRGGEAAALAERVTAGPGTARRGLALRLGPGAALEGQVVRASGGAPLAAAEVVLRPHQASAALARATADASGRFRVEGLAPGPWDVLAAAPGATPGRAEAVTLEPGRSFPLRLALAGLGAVEGVVTDPAGRPLARVRVRLGARGDGLAALAPREARTDFEGRFRLEDVEVGRAELAAVQDGAALGAARAVRVQAGRAAQVDFFLAPPGALAGRASAGGKPPPLGTAVLAATLQGPPQVARTLVDASGNFELLLPAGDYRVLAAPADAAGTDVRAAPAFARVEPGGTTRLELRVTAAAEEAGPEVRVLEPGGAPSAGAEVTLARPGDARVAMAARAGEDGRVRLGRDMGLAGREVEVRAHNGGRSGAFTGRLPAAGAVAVTLSPGAALEGVVRGGGAPVKGFALEVASQPGPEGWRTLEVHRFAGDRFELGDLPAGPLRVAVRAADGRRGEAEVRLAAGEVRRLEVAVSAAVPARAPAGR